MNNNDDNVFFKLFTLEDFVKRDSEENMLLDSIDLLDDWRSKEMYYCMENAYAQFKPFGASGHAVDKLVYGSLMHYSNNYKELW